MRFGLLGTGHWARSVHGPGLAAHPGAELVGVWGRTPERSAALAAELGTRAFGSPDALVREVDALSVALPPDVQAELAAPAAAAGRHLLLDKPLALDPPAARAVADAARASGVATAVLFSFRWSPELAADWAAVSAGDWSEGSVTFLAGNYDEASPYAGSQWRRRRGALWDLGPHALASLEAGLGPAERIRAVRGPEDQVALVAGHAGGATSTMVLSLTAPPAARRHAVSFSGPSGRLELDPARADAATALATALDALLAAAGGGPTVSLDAAYAADQVGVLAEAESSG